MRYLTDQNEIEQTKYYMNLAAEEAKKSTCRKSQRGAIIVKDDKILGVGHNLVTISELCNPCIRENIKDHGRVELCPAMHAEHRAIENAFKNGHSLIGSRLYHAKVKNGEIQSVGKPSCTRCSIDIYVNEIAEVVLEHKEGYAIYDAKEFNELSFEYFLKWINLWIFLS